MYIIVWAYRVRPDKQAEFEKTYAANGDWAELFKKGKGFLGTKLIRSDITFENYATVDTWETRTDYEVFLTQWKDEYETLDARCEGLTEFEQCLGKFDNHFS